MNTTRRSFLRGAVQAFAAACLASTMRWLPAPQRDDPPTSASKYRIGQTACLREHDGRFVFFDAGHEPASGHRPIGVVVGVGFGSGTVSIAMSNDYRDQVNQTIEAVTGRRADLMIASTEEVEEGVHRAACINWNFEQPPCA